MVIFEYCASYAPATNEMLDHRVGTRHIEFALTWTPSFRVFTAANFTPRPRRAYPAPSRPRKSRCHHERRNSPSVMAWRRLLLLLDDALDLAVLDLRQRLRGDLALGAFRPRVVDGFRAQQAPDVISAEWRLGSLHCCGVPCGATSFRPSKARAGIHNPCGAYNRKTGVMDSGLAASRRPGMTPVDAIQFTNAPTPRRRFPDHAKLRPLLFLGQHVALLARSKAALRRLTSSRAARTSRLHRWP